MKINDVILRAVTKLVVFIILTFAVFLFLAGHNNPGGGFIGGLVIASALVLLFLAFDIETVKKGIPFDFKIIAAIGVFLAIGTGVSAFFFDAAFLSMTSLQLNLPFFGETEFTTVTVFEAGVALAVVGVVITIILSISEDV